MKWSHPRLRASIGIAAGLAAFAATAALAFNRTADTGSASIAAATHLGPEGMPIPEGEVLGSPRVLRPGSTIDGIPCQRREKVAWHTHERLTIFVHGSAREVPADIGIGSPRQIAETARGAFVIAGTCFAWLHMHTADGIIHTESPVARTYTLGQFFDIWGQPLGRNRVGCLRGRVTAFVNGRIYNDNPRRITLLPHAQIQLDVGEPLVPPTRISFPAGL